MMQVADTDELTKAEFARWPLLLRKQHMERLGLTKQTLADLDRDGDLKPIYTRGGHRRWRKMEVAEIVRLKGIL